MAAEAPNQLCISSLLLNAPPKGLKQGGWGAGQLSSSKGHGDSSGPVLKREVQVSNQASLISGHKLCTLCLASRHGSLVQPPSTGDSLGQREEQGKNTKPAQDAPDVTLHRISRRCSPPRCGCRRLLGNQEVQSCSLLQPPHQGHLGTAPQLSAALNLLSCVLDPWAEGEEGSSGVRGHPQPALPCWKHLDQMSRCPLPAPNRPGDGAFRVCLL